MIFDPHIIEKVGHRVYIDMHGSMEREGQLYGLRCHREKWAELGAGHSDDHIMQQIEVRVEQCTLLGTCD